MPDKWLKDAWEFLFAVVLGLELAARHRLKLMREKLASGWSVVADVSRFAGELAAEAWGEVRGIAVEYWLHALPQVAFSHVYIAVGGALTIALAVGHEKSDAFLVTGVSAFVLLSIANLAVESTIVHRRHESWIDYYQEWLEHDRKLYERHIEVIVEKTKEAINKRRAESLGDHGQPPKWQAKSALLDACRSAMEAGAFASEEEMVEFVRWSREELAVAEMECDE